MNAVCANCIHFNSDPHDAEAMTPGLNTMSSGFAAVRSGDGVCDFHDRYVPAHATCDAFADKIITSL